jgi:phosphate starvation-inducible protein PhoH and related proteins
MKEPNRQRKNEIQYAITLNDEQKEAKRLIIENQIVIITGRAGSGKSLIGAITALDFLNKGQCDNIFVTRAAIEVGKTLGYLPGGLGEKFDPYIEALVENLYKCVIKEKKESIDNYIKGGQIKAMPIQFVRGKTIDDILIIEEAQNTTKAEMLALVTRLGKTGKIVINGDNEQQDTREGLTGLSYAIELSKHFEEIKHVKLKTNHRSDLVAKILDYEYGK